jgi:hypothetical protein
MIAHVSIGVRDVERSKRFDDAVLEPLGYKCIRAARTLRSGGHDNGAPGLRPEYAPDYYAAFIIDPDGYRIEAYYGPGET